MKTILFLILTIFSFNLSAVERVGTSNTLVFTENKGQITDQNSLKRPDITFYGSSRNFNFYLTQDGISYQLIKEDTSFALVNGVSIFESYRIDVNWLKPNENRIVRPGQRIAGYDNYYTPTDEVLNISSYRDITIENLYQGIDLKLYFNDDELEYDLIVLPFSDHSKLKQTILGADKITIGSEGQLLIETPHGIIEKMAPRAFQNNLEIDIRWKIEENEISFDIPYYDSTKILIIDPVVRVFGTYYGGNVLTTIYSSTTDNLNNVYVGGVTQAPNLIATTGAHQSSIGGGQDAFIAKFNSAGIRLWGTYYGGGSSESRINIASDSDNNIFLVGTTQSTNGIATLGGHQIVKGSLDDGFLVKFNQNGVRQWGTYFGGGGSDLFGYVTVDIANNVYISGTVAADGLGTLGTHAPNKGNGTDGILAKFNTNGVLIWSTYYSGAVSSSGSSFDDTGEQCATDSNLSVYLCGTTGSNVGFSTTNAHQTIRGGLFDAYLVKFDSTGNRIWGTYYGGSDYDYGKICKVDNTGNIILGGTTESSYGISTTNSHQPAFAGGTNDLFIVKFNSTGSRLWGTYYGGSLSEFIGEIAINNNNDLIVGGQTRSLNNIATPFDYQSVISGESDAFILKFSSFGVREWASYYGGTSHEQEVSISLDLNENIYLSGATSSINNISTSGAHQTSQYGSSSGFLVKFKECINSYYSLSVNICQGQTYTAPSGNNSWSVEGTYSDTIQNNSGCDSIITISLFVSPVILGPTLSPTICPNTKFIGPSGKIFTSAGVYTDTLQNNSGCDSVVTINLTIKMIDVSINTSNSPEFVANAENAGYQWLNCSLDMTPINSATSKNFVALENGVGYAVEISKDGCLDTSNCVATYNVGYSDVETNKLVLYPNPAKDEVTLQFIGPFNYTLIDEIGKTIKVGQCNGATNVIISDLPQGIYYFKIQINNELQTLQFQKM